MKNVGKAHHRLNWLTQDNKTKDAILKSMNLLGEANQTTIINHAQVSQSNGAQVMSKLWRMGILHKKRQGREVFYSINTQKIKNLNEAAARVIQN